MIMAILDGIYDKILNLLVDEKKKLRIGAFAALIIGGFLCAIGVLVYGVVMVKEMNEAMGWVPIFLGIYMAVGHTGICIYRIYKLVSK